MQIWADATKQIVSVSTAGDASMDNIDFLFSIIEANTNIPVLLTDNAGQIIQQRNFTLPNPDAAVPLSDSRNLEYLSDKLSKLQNSDNVIPIKIDEHTTQHLYYEDSTLLRNLSRYPYIQLLVMIAFVIVIYFAVTSSKKAEQNKVWVGLSKETAHQLGTPISSLMAWVHLMKDMNLDADMVNEMDKDVNRLSTIASRFSKIGSRPNMEFGDLNEIAIASVDYMSSRISSQTTVTLNESDTPLMVNMSAPLLQWVMENIIKNAVDAMEGCGTITVTTTAHNDYAIIDITDTGRGMTRRQRRAVFTPGYTTKKRGWGLGLTLAKRIIEQYHGGKIWVINSVPGVGSTFRIQLPLLH
ncbi:MAG: HAMP domain-containing histidine kinase [Paramuribaculum sp.]|nr:HAMP domain-containing histidine kinase [Paramuribaculum sp.]